MSIGKPNEVAQRIIAVFGTTTYFQQAGGSDKRTGILNPSFVPLQHEGLDNLDRAELRWGFPRPRINPTGDHWHASAAYSETQIGVFVAACETAYQAGYFESRLGISRDHATQGLGNFNSAIGSPDWLERTDLAMTKAGFEIMALYGTIADGGATKPFKPLPTGGELERAMDETRHPFWARSAVWGKTAAQGHEDEIFARQLAWLRRKDAEGVNVDELTPNSYGPGFQPSKLLARLNRLDELEAQSKSAVDSSSSNLTTSQLLRRLADQLEKSSD